MRQDRPHPCASYPVSYAYTAYSCEYIFISFSRCPRALNSSPPRHSTVSRTPLVAASDSHTRYSCAHVPRPASRPCRRPRVTCAPATRVPAGGKISTNITRGSPHPGHGGARPRAPFTSVNIYEYKTTKCDNIDLVRAHLIRYRTHIQHTRANTYSYPSAVVPAPSTPSPRHYYCLPHAVGRSFRLTHPLLVYPRAQAGFSSVPTSCHLRTCNARAYGRRDIDKHYSRSPLRDTAAHDLVPLLLALCPIFMNIKEPNAAG